MTKSTTSFLFPDVNVWLALSVERHSHHRVAAEWLERERQTLRLCFCRFTQMGLLRLLTTVELMGKDEVQTHQQAWRIYDSWMDDERVVFIPEPADLEVPLRHLTQLRRAAPRDWADTYLIAFTETAGLQLVTFDRAVAYRTDRVVFLKTEK